MIITKRFPHLRFYKKINSTWNKKYSPVFSSLKFHRTNFTVMKNYCLPKLFLLTCYLSFFITDYAQKLKRSESFAGFHFDFHATLQDSNIGKTFTYEMIDSFLRITRPDFVQVDCKGHPGISSYPTKVGTPAPSIEKDILKMWREVTDKYNVALYVHYSGIWDYEAVKQHPQWARVNADGSADKQATSLWSNYSDSLMIPQLKELALKYKVDGAWIDGDCWTLTPDYSPAALSAFKKATGIKEIPRKPGDKNYFELAEFNRKKFHDYVSHYVNAVHEARNDFQITSNWSFSSFIPEKVDVPVDFLSGDVAGNNSLYSSAFESRCMALQGKPWDLMSWSFATRSNFSLSATKPFAQLAQEASEVIAMGGGYQTYWTQNNDGSIKPYLVHEMEQIIKFCRERQPYCFRGEIVPQIGLLYSSYAWRRIPSSGLYNGAHLESLKGTLDALLDIQLPVEVLMDHQLNERLKNYPVIIFPDWQTLDPEIKQSLLQYVNDGGNLLISGASAVNVFKDDLNLDIEGDATKDTDIIVGLGGNTQIVRTKFLRASKNNGTKQIGVTLKQNDFRFLSDAPPATVQQYGKGKIAIIYFDVAGIYTEQQSPVLRDLLKATINEIFSQPMITVKGSSLVHQVISRKNGKLYVHLINAGGQHSNPNVLVYDEVPPINQLTVAVRLEKKPASVTLQPEHKQFSFTWKNNIAEITVPQLKIYSILEIE